MAPLQSTCPESARSCLSRPLRSIGKPVHENSDPGLLAVVRALQPLQSRGSGKSAHLYPHCEVLTPDMVRGDICGNSDVQINALFRLVPRQLALRLQSTTALVRASH